MTDLEAFKSLYSDSRKTFVQKNYHTLGRSLPDIEKIKKKMKLQIIIPGTPQPKQSVRSTIITDAAGRLKVRHHQTEKIINNEKAISLQAKVQLPKGFRPFTGPIAITKLHYYFKPQKHWPKFKLKEMEEGKIFYKHTKPDVTDNLAKPVFDALEGLIYLNDSQICRMDNIAKMYSQDPRIEIEFEEL